MFWRALLWLLVASICPRLPAQISPYLGDQLLGQELSFSVSADNFLSGFNLGDDFASEGTARILLNLSYQGSSGQTVQVSRLPAFCVDLYQPIGTSSYSGFVAQEAQASHFPASSGGVVVSARQLLALELLFSTSFDSVESYFSLLGSKTSKWSTTKIAGFQLAIWEITHDAVLNSSGDYDFSLGSGDLYAPYQSTRSLRNAVSEANAFLAGVRAALADNEMPTMHVAVLQHATYQDLVFPYLEAPPIPEPGVYALGGTGLLAAVVLLRRRKARVVASNV